MLPKRRQAMDLFLLYDHKRSIADSGPTFNHRAQSLMYAYNLTRAGEVAHRDGPSLLRKRAPLTRITLFPVPRAQANKGAN